MATNMLSLPAYTEEMAQRGETSMTPGSGSLFNPNQLSLPGPTMGAMEMTPDFEAYQNFFKANYNPATGSDQLPGQWAAMTPEQKASYNQSQAPGPTEQMPGMMAPLTPAEQLNTPSFEQLAQPMPAPPPPTDYAMPAPPPPSVTPVPVTQPTPGTSNLIQQIQAPVAGLPPSPATMPGIPVTQPTPGATNLIQQIQAPTTPRPVAQPNQATQQFAQQFRPQPAAQPRPQPKPAPKPVARPQPIMAPKPVARPQPVVAPRPMVRPQPVMAPRPMARSVSQVNPPLLPSRPMGRR